MMVSRFVRDRQVVIVSDNDHVGRTGAEKLAARLIHCCPDVRIIQPSPSIKDLRAWLRAGLTPDDLYEAISNAEPIKTTIRFKCVGKYTE
jgi:hypothetical protein